MLLKFSLGKNKTLFKKQKKIKMSIVNWEFCCYFISGDEILDPNYNTLYLKGNSFVQRYESLLLDSDIEALVLVD